MRTIYKYLIESGELHFFEQGREYLIRHDKEFIAPYLERYTSGKFTDKEHEMFEKLSINEEYIQRLSKELTK